MRHTEIQTILSGDFADKQVVVRGWVRTKRSSKNVAFINLNDGSTINTMQAVLPVEHVDFEKIEKIHTGTSLEIEGLIIESQGSGQRYELQVEHLTILGEANPEEYPLQPKKHSLEFLREIAHLRFRTNTFNAVFRIRHGMTFAIHSSSMAEGFIISIRPLLQVLMPKEREQCFR